MYKNKKILCIIPARGGSKRLPGKNIKLLNGMPLIGYAIAAAKCSQYIDKVIVSTDDETIACVAREQEAEVPFMRPAELALDTVHTAPVLQHAVKQTETEGLHFDFIVLMQPNSPGVLTQDVDSAIEELERSGANSCVSVCEITDRPERMYRMVEGRITTYVGGSQTRSQDMPKLFRLNGAVYVMTRATLMGKGVVYDDNDSCVAIVMPRERSVDIDTEFDFAIAKVLMERKI